MHPARHDPGFRSRREFLVAGLGGAVAGGVAATALAEGDATLEIIDAHTHFFDPTRPEGVPFPSKNDKVLYRPILPDEFRKLAEPHGVVGTVVVEASPWLEDNQWLLNLAAKDRYVVGIVGNLDPRADDFKKHVRRFAANPLFRGIRMSVDRIAEGLQRDLVDRCKLLVDHDLELDVNGAGVGVAPKVAALARAVPDLRIVINHCANIGVNGKEPPAGYREGMAEAAGCAKVYCKVSALRAEKSVDFYRPLLDTLWGCFGEDRLVFGSNWPVDNRDDAFGTVIDSLRGYFAEKGPVATRKFFHDNSQAAYAWRRRH
jgi:predicted TIM-barrel fold metal-dependent hydrolase